MNMDQAEKHEIIIAVLTEKVASLQLELESMAQSRQYWMNEWNNLRYETVQLKPKRGRPVKKRGPGRPKGSKNKAQAGLKMVLRGGVRK